jgi:hypothetical protein
MEMKLDLAHAVDFKMSSLTASGGKLETTRYSVEGIINSSRNQYVKL